MDQYGVYLPLVYLTVDPSEKERARKETGGRVGGGGGVTDNILFNYCLNKNIVFLERKKLIQVKRDERNRNEEQTSNFANVTK